MLYTGPVIEPLAQRTVALSLLAVKLADPRKSWPIRPVSFLFAPAKIDTQRKTQMDESLRSQIDTYLSHLDGLMRRGQQLRDTWATNPSTGEAMTADGMTAEAMTVEAKTAEAMTATRLWQEDCGVTINQLSGGSKAHWLARAFSQAFLKRSGDGRAAQGASPAEIVEQLMEVLGLAATTLSQSGESAITSASSEQPAPRRFEFVHKSEIRPVLEQAYADGRSAMEKADHNLAMMTFCGILEAIVTDALEHKGSDALAAMGAPAGKLADWTFETRLAVAEKAGLIRSGCARLPAAARAYRERESAEGENAQSSVVSQRDARTTGQVLHVIMRDLDPGR